jgi:hypothetical protein
MEKKNIWNKITEYRMLLMSVYIFIDIFRLTKIFQVILSLLFNFIFYLRITVVNKFLSVDAENLFTAS